VQVFYNNSENLSDYIVAELNQRYRITLTMRNVLVRYVSPLAR